MRIRAATEDDLHEIERIERSATSLYREAGFAASEVEPRSIDDLRRVLAETSVFVAEEEGPVGYVSFYAAGPYLHLEELAVARQAQGRGVGGLLLAHYLESAASLPECSHLSLMAFHDAVWATGLYQRWGFRVVSVDSPGLPRRDVLARIVEDEAAAGLDVSRRQLMVRGAFLVEV